MRTTVVALLMLLLTGCKTGLDRTEFDEWELHAFTEAGLSIEMPTDAYYISGGSEGIYVGMHPVWPPRFVIDEPRSMLELQGRRIAESERKEELVYLIERDDYEFWEWHLTFHSAISKRTTEGGHLYRYDVRCEDDSIIELSVGLMVITPTLEDERAFEKMLLSATCL